MKMQGRRGFRLAYGSTTQDIAECNTDIVQFLSEYMVILSFTTDGLRFLTTQIVTDVQLSLHQKTAQANAGVSM